MDKTCQVADQLLYTPKKRPQTNKNNKPPPRSASNNVSNPPQEKEDNSGPLAQPITSPEGIDSNATAGAIRQGLKTVDVCVHIFIPPFVLLEPV